jgi:hypothetical protein
MDAGEPAVFREGGWLSRRRAHYRACDAIHKVTCFCTWLFHWISVRYVFILRGHGAWLHGPWRRKHYCKALQA